MRARTVLPLSRSAQCDWVMFLRCSGVSVLMSTSMKTCCDFIGSLSFFIVDCFLLVESFCVVDDSLKKNPFFLVFSDIFA